MGFKVPKTKTKSTNFKVLDAGQYDGVLVGIVELGMHESFYQGASTGVHDKLLLLFDIPSEKLDSGKCVTVSKEVKVSLDERAHFYKALKALTGKADVVGLTEIFINTPEKLLGKTAVIDVQNYIRKGSQTKENPEGDVRHAVGDITRLDPRVEQPVPESETFLFTFEDADVDVFKNNITKYTRQKILSAVDANELDVSIHQAQLSLEESEASSNDVIG